MWLSANTSNLGIALILIQVGMSFDSSSERKKDNLARVVILKISYIFKSSG